MARETNVLRRHPPTWRASLAKLPF